MSDVLTRRDAKLRRCICGGWVYGRRPCQTCRVLEETGQEAA